MRYMMCFFPVVGLVIGVVIGLWVWFSQAIGFGPTLFGAGLALLPIAVSGGIHMDGFCDVVDAQSSHAEPTRKREILKDPHSGAFAAIAVAAYIVAYAAVASELVAGWRIVVLLAGMHIASRCMSGIATVVFPTSSSKGMLSMFHESARGKSLRRGDDSHMRSGDIRFARWACVPRLALSLCAIAIRWHERRSRRLFPPSCRTRNDRRACRDFEGGGSVILVVGGIASGKRSYAHSLGFADSDMSEELSSSCPVLLDAQELVRSEDVDAASLVDTLAATKQVVLCQEVGSGIVPISRGERDWRDRVGALSKNLAERADAVVRMVSGIPQVLKGADWLESHGFGQRCAGGDHPAFGTSFFTNRACEHFPCHEGIDERDFNCLFCYCPLYALGPDCGGNFTYTKSGRKNCKNCALPHVRENGVKLVSARYEQLAELARDEGK